MLSPRANKLLDNYFNLPFKDVSDVRCPYYINKKYPHRGQLKALVGKGTPTDIVEEAKIISIQYWYGIFDKHGLCHIPTEKRAEELRKYLIDVGLGIDCSGFVTHILNVHFKEANGLNILRLLPRAYFMSFFRELICFFRPVENIGVRAYVSDKTTTKIEKISDISPADVVVMLEIGPNKKRNHILLITEINGNTIKYAHARAWSCEGQYGHGVAKGEIYIVNPNDGLLEQEWTEFKKTGDQNETFLEAKNARVLEVRRIKI